MYVHSINPVLLSIGPVKVMYYSLAYIIGAVISYFIIKKLARERKLGMGRDDVLNYVTYLLAGIIIGGRLGYILFYNLKYYLNNPLEVFAVWLGGMSFHGGLIGAVTAAYIFCRKYRIDFWKIADITVIPVAIGLFLGRIGNFINGELYGRITDVPWAVKFKGAECYRHPSQLYEALKNAFIFSALWALKDKKMPPGFLFWLFVAMYGTLRFIIEFSRQPDAHIGFFLHLTRGQWLCLAMILVEAFMFYRIKRKW